MVTVKAAVRPMELWLSLLIVAVLGKWTFDAFRRNFGRGSNAVSPDFHAKPSSTSGEPGLVLPESQTQTRYETLQRERSWARHRIATARPRPTEETNLLCKLDQMAARGSFWRRTKQSEVLKSYAAWRKYDLEIQRQLRRGPETDEERAFDAAARSVAEIDSDLDALPATRLTVEEIAPPQPADAVRSGVVRIRVRCNQSRWDDGYRLDPRIPDPSPYGIRSDSITRAAHACLTSSIGLREAQYYDGVMRAEREYTHYAWSIRASQALYDTLVATILGEMTAEDRERLEVGRLFTEKTAAFLDVPTSLPTSLAGRKLPDLRVLPVQPPVGVEPLRVCTLHFRSYFGRDGYGPIIKSLRLTETPPP